jgi:thiosulfate/3-mercaptopyruvate sulfurtransferase
MAQPKLLSVQELSTAQDREQCVIFDCRFVLSEPGSGYEKFLKSHIPGAVYAHLDNDLAGPVTSDSGRHPLPDANKFAEFLGRSGWQPGTMLVAYDDAGGAIAARLWWLMMYFGHDCATLLDGGFAAWETTGYALESGPVSPLSRPAANFRACDDLVISTSEIIAGLQRNSIVLADARAPERFRGETEAIDSVAGHIPGAVNYPIDTNLTPDGMFKPVEQVKNGILALTGNHGVKDLVHMCGSGVSACHNIFATEMAGLESSKLYVGSWSEWIRDPSRPVG